MNPIVEPKGSEPWAIDEPTARYPEQAAQYTESPPVTVGRHAGEPANCWQQLVGALPDDEEKVAKLKKLFMALARKVENDRRSLINSLRSLKDIVSELQKRGIPRETITAWAIEARWAESTARFVVSRLWCGGGHRINAKGQGRVHSAEAAELLRLAVDRYGEEEAVRLWGAARRLGEKRLKSRTISSQ